MGEVWDGYSSKRRNMQCPHLTMETDAVTETLCFLVFGREYRTMDKVQKPSNSDSTCFSTLYSENIAIRDLEYNLEIFLFQVGYLTTLSVSRQYSVYYRMINKYGGEGKM
jgi:hypothetical protein